VLRKRQHTVHQKWVKRAQEAQNDYRTKQKVGSAGSYESSFLICNLAWKSRLC
jgi:hypothetical protein